MRTMEIVQLLLCSVPSATLQTTQAIRNACIDDKTDEVNILLLKIEQDVSGSKFFGHSLILQQQK